MDWMQFLAGVTEVAPWLIGGAGAVGLITFSLEGRREHRRWIRDKKAHAYSEIFAKANMFGINRDLIYIQHARIVNLLEHDGDDTVQKLPALNKELERLQESGELYIDEFLHWIGVMSLFAPHEIIQPYYRLMHTLDNPKLDGDLVDLEYQRTVELNDTHNALTFFQERARKDLGTKPRSARAWRSAWESIHESRPTRTVLQEQSGD